MPRHLHVGVSPGPLESLLGISRTAQMSDVSQVLEEPQVSQTSPVSLLPCTLSTRAVRRVPSHVIRKTGAFTAGLFLGSPPWKAPAHHGPPNSSAYSSWN